MSDIVKACSKCEETDCIIAANYNGVGADVRIDVDACQLDVFLGYVDADGMFTDYSGWDGAVDINYCPFCGRSLRVEDCGEYEY